MIYFYCANFFEIFFRENFSDIFPDRFSRSLAALQGKILGQPGTHYPIRSSCHRLTAFPLESGCKGTHFFHSRNNRFPSRKRMQRYALFSFSQYFLQVFFKKNYRFTPKYLLINEKSNRVFFNGVTDMWMCGMVYTL